VNVSPRAPLGPSVVCRQLAGRVTVAQFEPAYLDSWYTLLRDWHRLPEIFPGKKLHLLLECKGAQNRFDFGAHVDVLMSIEAARTHSSAVAITLYAPLLPTHRHDRPASLAVKPSPSVSWNLVWSTGRPAIGHGGRAISASTAGSRGLAGAMPHPGSICRCAEMCRESPTRAGGGQMDGRRELMQHPGVIVTLKQGYAGVVDSVKCSASSE
jgi:hypothetical protein